MNYQYHEWKKQLFSRNDAGLLILSFPAIQKMGICVKQLVQDSTLQKDAMLLIAKELPDQQAIVSMMDLSLEAEAFGAQVLFEENEIPAIKGVLIHNEEEAKALPIPRVEDTRCQIYVDAIKQVMDSNPDRPVFAGVIGPYSLAGRLMDVSEIMIQCMMDPDYVKLVLRKTTDFLKSYIRTYKEVGANGVIMAEPLAGLLSSEMLQEFSSTYIKEIVDELQDESFSIFYHNCGPSVVSAIDEIIETNCAGYHFGNAIALEEILSKVDSDILVMGNLDPVKCFMEGSKQDMEVAVQELLDHCGSYPNFVASSGCDIPPKASWENIHTFFECLKK